MVYVTRTPVMGSGFCANTSAFGPTVTRRPLSGFMGSSFGNSFGPRIVTRTPVGSAYYGNSFFGSPCYSYLSSTYYTNWHTRHTVSPLLPLGLLGVGALCAALLS